MFGMQFLKNIWMKVFKSTKIYESELKLNYYYFQIILLLLFYYYMKVEDDYFFSIFSLLFVIINGEV